METRVEHLPMEASPKPRGTKAAYRDLREWIAAMDALGEVRHIDNADWDLEIGAICEIVHQKSRTNPALLFDQVPGYPKGYRVLSNLLKSLPQVAFTLNIPGELKNLD